MSAKICARCIHFRFRDDQGAVYPQIAHGLGRCDGFDGQHPVAVPFVPWDAPPCILYGLATDVDKRREWIDKQFAKEQK